jgi:hypothetical protein
LLWVNGHIAVEILMVGLHYTATFYGKNRVILKRLEYLEFYCVPMELCCMRLMTDLYHFSKLFCLET